MNTIKSTSKNIHQQHIVLLHGWTPDVTVIDRWEPLKKLLEKAGYTVHLWKIPGLTTETKKTFTIEQYQDWLFKKISPLKSCVLVGHSFGGQLATIFATKHPELLSKLILVDSSGIVDFSPRKVIKRYLFKTLAKIGFIFKKSVFLRKILYKFIREKDYFEANTAQRETMNHALAYSVKPFLHSITTPTLILWGENDQTTPLYLGKIFHQQIPNSNFIVLPARHSPIYTHPQLVFEKMYTFIQV